jgi:hypothetical protein
MLTSVRGESQHVMRRASVGHVTLQDYMRARLGYLSQRGEVWRQVIFAF